MAKTKKKGLDINSTLCCADDKYCLIDPSTQQPACCSIGSQCGSPCSESQYQCNVTTTLAPTSTTTSAACCSRRCTATSMFACPNALGGGCCSYGQACGPKSICVSTAASPFSTLVSMLPPGCTTSQIACAASEGGGCCSVGNVCTVITSTNYCALSTVTPTGNVTAVAQDDGGLSAGTRAGVGVGVAVGAGLVIGAVTWLCIRRRRDRSQRGGRRSNVPMSESTSDVVSRAGPLRGLAQDYFGPDAVAGPYTDTGTSGVTTPGQGVPVEPQGPADIVAPVEIDSLPKDGRRASVMHSQQVPDTIDGRFELYGSENPSPNDGVTSPSEQPTPASPQPAGSSADVSPIDETHSSGPSPSTG